MPIRSVSRSIFRRLAAVAVASASAFTIGILLFLPGCASSGSGGGPASKAPPQRTFRVMTYNIHHGEGLDKSIDLERIAKLILSERADIVALEEVDKGVQRTARRDLPAELAKLTGMTCLFTNNFHYQGGEYGNAILTRFPVQSWTNLHYRMIRQGEQRGLLQARLSIHGRALVFMTTHIDYRKDDTERLSNVEEMFSVAAGYGSVPLLVAGDFNDYPNSRVWNRMSERFEDSWKLVGIGEGLTIPAEAHKSRIDYIWVRKGSAMAPRKAWVPTSEASDHLPLVVEFDAP